MKKLFSLILVSLISYTSVQAESLTGGVNNNPFANVTPAASPARSGDSRFFSSTGDITQDTVGNDQNGLEYKLNDANRQSNAGAGAAYTAAGLLTGAAVAALVAMDYPEAGRLFGMAGMEFGQGAASSATGSANNDNRNTLLASANQNASNVDTAGMANALLTPEAQAALSAAGVNPSAFMNNLVSGGIRSGADALNALGQNPTAEQAAAANDYSSVDMAALGGAESLGPEYRSLLGIQDDAKPNSTGSSNGSYASGGSASPTNNPSQSPSSNGSGSLNGAGAHGIVANGAKPASNALAAKFGLNGVVNLSEIFAAFGQGKELDPAAMALLRAELLTRGISKTKGQNIFRLANRNFRSFNKWRAMKNRKSSKQPERGIASVVN